QNILTFPTRRSSDLKLGHIVFNGNFAGFINDFVTYGTLHTALGTIKADVNLKLQQAEYPIYSGTVHSDNFQLGQFIKDSAIGAIDRKSTRLNSSHVK